MRQLESALQILNIVSEYSGLPAEVITSKSRKSEVVMWRQLAAYFIRKNVGMGTQNIANVVGTKNHSTILRGLKVVESHIDVGDAFMYTPFFELRQILDDRIGKKP